jgi:1,4-dihydroxy-2-naphthoyl-CoA hydrolase
MAIWFQDVTLETLNTLSHGTALSHMGIEFTDIGDDWLRATMPVDGRTRQPAGILHGGASVLLAETLGSVASTLCVDRTEFACVGLEISANHLRSVQSGHVTGTARPLHIGRSTHVWDIRIETPDARLVCASRFTVCVINTKERQ